MVLRLGGATLMARDERAWLRYRLIVLLLVVGGLWSTAWATGANRVFDVERLRTIVEATGIWSGAVFVVVFSVGQLLRIPGPVFVGVAILAFGRTTGTVAAVVGAIVSVTVNFVIVRTIAGQPLAYVQRPIVRRFLSQIDKHPIAVVAILRLIFQAAPPLNYALAMTQVRLRDHLIGSTLGLPLPIAATALVLDWLLHRAP